MEHAARASTRQQRDPSRAQRALVVQLVRLEVGAPAGPGERVPRHLQMRPCFWHQLTASSLWPLLSPCRTPRQSLAQISRAGMRLPSPVQPELSWQMLTLFPSPKRSCDVVELSRWIPRSEPRTHQAQVLSFPHSDAESPSKTCSMLRSRPRDFSQPPMCRRLHPITSVIRLVPQHEEAGTPIQVFLLKALLLAARLVGLLSSSLQLLYGTRGVAHATCRRLPIHYLPPPLPF